MTQLLKVQINVPKSILLLRLSQCLHHLAEVDQCPLGLTNNFVRFYKCSQRVTQHRPQQSRSLESAGESRNPDIDAPRVNLVEPSASEADICARSIAAERYAYAITCIYLAEALGFAPDALSATMLNDRLMRLAVKQVFRADVFHAPLPLALRDQAEALSQREDAGDLARSARLAEQALALTLKTKGASVKEDLDAEIAASLYRIQSDIAWRTDRRLLAAAVVTAYFWKDVWNQSVNATPSNSTARTWTG